MALPNYQIVVPYVALSWWMNRAILGNRPEIDGNALVQFYSNSYTPCCSTTLANFTATACPGITSYLLSGAQEYGQEPECADLWVWPYIYPTSASGSGYPYTIYGYWVTSTYDGGLLWCQQFETRWEFWGPGDVFTFLPTFAASKACYLDYVLPLPLPVYLTADDSETPLYADDGETILFPR